MMKLRNVDGTTLDLPSLTAMDAAAIAPALARGWAFGKEEMVSTFVPLPSLEVAPDKAPLEPLTPAQLEAVTAALGPGASMSSAEVAARAKVEPAVAQRVLRVLAQQGKAACVGRGRGATWHALAPAPVTP